MQKLKNSLFILVFILFGMVKAYASFVNDTIPPIFINLPVDTSVLCGENIDSLFTLWYINNGGASLDEDSALVNKTLEITLAIDSLNSLPINCSDSGPLTIGFYGIDTCGNSSVDTLFANFQIIDNVAPQVTQQATSTSVECNDLLQDSLTNWLNSIGGAQATDICSNTANWINLIWEDNQGNSGFANIGDNYNIPLQRDSCDWQIDVAFFVQDLCGNINNTRASFSIARDTINPTLISFPNDTTIVCNNNLDTIPPVFFDACDNTIQVNLVEQSTQDPDSTKCEHYNYTLDRVWTGQDVCQNDITFTQKILIVDTLPPVGVIENIIIKDCDEDLTNIEDFISASDNCSEVTITFTDSLTVNNICQKQFIRKWRLSDICGNTNTLNQTIQTQDFSPPNFTTQPKDTMISCDGVNIIEEFENWINQFAGAQVEDNCNSSFLYASSISDLTDTSSIINGDLPEFQISNCQQNLSNDLVSVQEVYFYTFDECANISSSKATFALTDTVAPVIENCPDDIDVILPMNECDGNISLQLPNFTDSCLDNSNANWSVVLDDDFNIKIENSTIDFGLEVGDHHLLYTISDCADNQSTCLQNILIRDTFPPSLLCPDDINIDLPFDICEAEIVLPTLLDFTDNCFGSSDFDVTLPSGDAFVNFELDPIDSTYQAISFPIEFDGIITEGRLFKPSIIIEYALNISDGSNLILKSEFGDDLFEMTNTNCEIRKEKLLIDENQFVVWSLDNDIKFTVLFQRQNGNGTTPCDLNNISGQIDNDGFSFFKVTLQFSDIVPTYFVEDEDQNVLTSNISDVILSQGNYNLVFEAFDFGNNIGQCKTEININDVSPPTISCTDQILEISPDSSSQLNINLDDLSIFIGDNCGLLDASFFPTKISCLDIGKVVPINIQAIDINDNFSECIANITITGSNLSPTFISGLCFADSLKLFSNIELENIENYFWTGPNNFESRDIDPILTNINNQNTGIYNLVITNEDGCTFEGSVDVQINQFTSPQISSTSLQFCMGDQVLLNSNAFTENVNYFWYEGLSPNGILIDETDGPTLEITPSLGEHLYYVEVIGEGCNSNPSSTLEIEILSPPQAIIENPFITICQGDDILLSTDVFDANFTYDWNGPDGYTSNQQFGEVISNAQEVNAGQYSLVINNGACNSLPAIAEVIIFEPPIQPIIEGESIFCEGQSSVLTVSNISNATRYHWYFNGTLFSSVSNNNLLIPSINNSQSGNWTVVVEDAICFSDTSEVFEIFVESSLNIGASNNGPVCDGDSISLTSSFIPNATYQWQDPSGNFIDGREINIQAIDGIYSVTVTTASNCIATTSTDVTVGARPTITALSNTSLDCMMSGGSISLVPTVFPQGNYRYEWNGPNGYESSEIQPIVQNIDQNDAGVYELIVIQDNCASEPVTTNVDYTVIPEIAEIIGDSKLCEGEDLFLEIDNAIQGNQTLWLWTTPLGPISTNEPTLNIPNFNSSQVGNYTVTQELNGCRSEISEVLLVELEDKPPTPLISGQMIICQGTTTVISASSEPNANYLWITPNGQITTNTNTLEINNASDANSGSYQVITQKTNCISDTSQTFNIEIISSPNSPQFLQNEINICADNTQQLDVCVSTNNLDFDKLVIIDQLTNTIIQESNTTCFDLTFLIGNVSQEYNLTVAAIRNNCSSENNDNITINIFESPDAFLEILEDTIYLCDQEFLTITPDVIPDLVEANWSSPDPEINIFNATELNPSFSNLRDGNNQLIITSSFGSCLNYAQDIVNVFVISEIDAEDDIYVGEYNQSLTINPLENDIYSSEVFINDIENTDDGTVTINGGQVTIPAQNNFIGSFDLEYEICYIDCPELCSKASITINIGDNIDCFAGNVITPNDDGFNDVFTIPCLDSGNYNDNSLIVFNEWGDEVFSAAPYLNNWAGTFQNKTLPVGTYFYILNLGDSARPIQGFIVLEN